MKTFYYVEDNQGYYFQVFKFKTNAPYSRKKFEKLSWSPVEAGRFSISFLKFKKIIEEKGFKVKFLKKYKKNKIPKKAKKLIFGATGNY